MKATITQFDARALESEWTRLRRHAAAEQPELLLLPEMCFSPWFCTSPRRSDLTWERAAHDHAYWLGRLPELGARRIVGTAPRNIGGKRFNSAYLWTDDGGIRWIHHKTYLPNDDGYWEANWYDRAPIDFEPVCAGDLSLGIMICTELWFMQHAREYGRRAVQLLLNPRSTPLHTNDKWLAGGRAAAVVSGAFCLSSNHAGHAGRMELGGAGWICDPDGVLLATTSAEEPFVTLNLDLEMANEAKSTYPRYVDDCEF
ncbi:MAG: carbon-nitrogen hydrolase family protein [Chloroflexota bacterium]|nr:carbon-nitrogen hydrolase family protein [Chloroflexota bacterium]